MTKEVEFNAKVRTMFCGQAVFVVVDGPNAGRFVVSRDNDGIFPFRYIDNPAGHSGTSSDQVVLTNLVVPEPEDNYA